MHVFDITGDIRIIVDDIKDERDNFAQLEYYIWRNPILPFKVALIHGFEGIQVKNKNRILADLCKF